MLSKLFPYKMMIVTEHAWCNMPIKAALTASEERVKELEEYIQQMVAKIADEKLDGYRELGAKCAELENKNDGYKSQLATLRTENEGLRERLKLHEALMRRRTMSPQMDGSHIAEVELIKVKAQLDEARKALEGEFDPHEHPLLVQIEYLRSKLEEAEGDKQKYYELWQNAIQQAALGKEK
jgi:hypothetical protein